MKRWTPFRIYCREVQSSGFGNAAYAAARLVLMLGGRTAKDCLKHLEHQLATDIITGDEYAVRVDAVEQLDAMYQQGVSTEYDPCLPADGWERMPGGNHRKRNVGRSGH